MLSENLMSTIAMLKSSNFDLAKATFTQPTSATVGPQLYPIELPAKAIIPIILPLLKGTPRSGGGRSIQAHWDIFSSQNASNLTAGVPEARRNAVISYNLSRYNATYKTLSMEGSATWQAVAAAAGYALPSGGDLRGQAREFATKALFVEQERILFGGNTTNTGIALGTGPTPSVTKSATGGTIATANAFVRVVPLSVEGVRQATVSATGVVGPRTVSPNGGGATFVVNTGNGQVSAEGTIGSMTGSTNQVSATWTAVAGAAGYAVYSGSTTGAATQYITSIVFVNAVTLNALGVNTNQAANAAAVAADYSQDQWVYDGMFTQTVQNGYHLSLNAATLTATGKGGINEFDAFFIDRYTNGKFTNFEVHVGGNMLNNIIQKTRTGSGAANPIVVTVTDGKPDFMGGGSSKGYIHPLTGDPQPYVLNPNVPDGMVFFKGTSLPAWFLNSNITNIWEVGERISYTARDWPEVDWSYNSAALVDEVLKGYVPQANGVVDHILIG